MKSRIMRAMGRICDDVMADRETKVEGLSRRIWVQNFAAISGSAAVLWACGGKDDDKAKADDAEYTVEQKKTDAGTLNVALDLEHEAIALYTAAADLDVWGTDASALAPTFKAIALKFAAHHTSHRDAVIAQVNAIKADTGIEPVTALTTYLDKYPGIGDLTGASGLLAVLQVAAEREMNAANTYHSVISSFINKELTQTLGGLSSDEAAHYGVLNAAALAHDALALGGTESKLTADNLVAGALLPFSTPYPRVIRT